MDVIIDIEPRYQEYKAVTLVNQLKFPLEIQKRLSLDNAIAPAGEGGFKFDNIV